MIRSVRGRVLAHETDGPVIEVGGVGLLVRVSATTAGSLPAPGAEASLMTVLVVREESLDLYGFATAAERALFEAFTTVSGVGPRLALAICAVAPPDELRLAIARGDSARLQAANGVGKRTAERLVLELRDRLGALDGAAPATGGGAAADAHLAARDGLVALGFRVDEADAALADAPAGLDAEGLVRHGLGRLRRA
ncbi:Holliday junction branch migration protein RuvA [Miltoncostaea marina]|uniref:Holliday junction branch migration protein RuvA n=1 Tax=Miltoncostaea marina TaxID=2843215 RepID=UPI001C3D0C6F|nr:Holliday junction branch migration protein RuvA [Miltoncostaea marina]